MDAANPLSRWSVAVGLLLLIAAGCQSAVPVARPQAPAYEPLAPLPPTPPATPYTGPVSPAAPVQGQPLTRTVPAAYSPTGVGLPKSSAVPQAVLAVKPVAIVGGNIVTD